jgi:hypothetical protein
MVPLPRVYVPADPRKPAGDLPDPRGLRCYRWGKRNGDSVISVAPPRGTWKHTNPSSPSESLTGSFKQRKREEEAAAASSPRASSSSSASHRSPSDRSLSHQTSRAAASLPGRQLSFCRARQQLEPSSPRFREFFVPVRQSLSLYADEKLPATGLAFCLLSLSLSV